MTDTGFTTSGIVSTWGFFNNLGDKPLQLAMEMADVLYGVLDPRVRALQ